MRQPLHITADIFRLQARNAIRRNKRYPFVLMLEPLHTCNLSCLGCSVERHTGKLGNRLSVARCVGAVDQCGAPVVSICGGEPLLYPELGALVGAILARRKHIYLCTNGLLLEQRLFGTIRPDRRLSLNVHLDGMRDTHDFVCDRAGTFDRAIEMIGAAKRLGYHVTTNTTVFKETRVEEIEELCALLSRLGIDGILISPGYEYQQVREDIFATRADIESKFRRILELARRYPITSTPLFLEFAAGLRDYPCSPWSTVTFTPRGWKRPCYLIGETYTFDWHAFWNQTDWDYWESRRDRRCQGCAMHSGFEASATIALRRRPRDAMRMVRWALSR